MLATISAVNWIVHTLQQDHLAPHSWCHMYNGGRRELPERGRSLLSLHLCSLDGAAAARLGCSTHLHLHCTTHTAAYHSHITSALTRQVFTTRMVWHANRRTLYSHLACKPTSTRTRRLATAAHTPMPSPSVVFSSRRLPFLSISGFSIPGVSGVCCPAGRCCIKRVRNATALVLAVLR